MAPTSSTPTSIFTIIRDALLITALLAGLNALIARQDPGWLQSNPSPWLLPALLLGLRYGLIPGTLTGLVTAAGLGALLATLSSEPLGVAFQQHAYPLSAIALAGFLGGESHRLLRAKTTPLEIENQWLEGERGRLIAELDLQRENRHLLQRQLALWNAPLATFDDDLRGLMALPEPQMWAPLLNTCYRTCQITTAAFYQRDGTLLNQLASLHPTPELGQHLQLAEVPLADQALEQNTLASIPIADASSPSSPFLAALPWHLADGTTGVLLIQDMPLEAFNWQTLARLESIVHWATRLRQHAHRLREKHGGRAELEMEDFLLLIGEALTMEARHHLPSTVVRLTLGAASATPLKTLVKELRRHLPEHAALTLLPGNQAVAILSLFTPLQEMERLASQWSASYPGLSAATFLIAQPSTPQALWTTLLES